MDKKRWKYKIDGGVGCGTILVFLMMVGMAALCLWFHKTGKEHRIPYDKGLFEREISILASRINQSQR